MNGQKEKTAKLLEKMNLKLKGDDKDKEGKQLLKVKVLSEINHSLVLFVQHFPSLTIVSLSSVSHASLN